MTHKNVYKQYDSTLPIYSNSTIAWFPNGKNSIRVRQGDGAEYVFTCEDENSFTFETLHNYLKRSMKGEK